MVRVEVVHLANKQLTVTVAAETVGELLPLLEGEDGFGTGSVRKPDGTLLGPSQSLPPETSDGPATLMFKPKAGVASTSGQAEAAAGGIGADAVTSAAVRELQKQVEVLNCEVQVLKFSTIVADKLFQYNEDNMTRGSNAPFKTNLLQEYGSVYGSIGCEIMCMLSGKRLPSRLVIASHIVKHSWQEYGIHEAMGFNTDDAGNGLLLFKPFEWAFDNSKLCFVYDHRFDHFVMHILDPGLRALPVLHMFHHPGVYTPHVQDYVAHTQPELVAAAERAFADTTFNDYHAHWLKLPEATRPFKRALCFHAHRARRFAISSGWFDDSEWRFDDFWSEGAPNKVELWLAAVEGA